MCLSKDKGGHKNGHPYQTKKFDQYLSNCLNCGAKVTEYYKKVYTNSVATFKEEDDERY